MERSHRRRTPRPRSSSCSYPLIRYCDEPSTSAERIGKIDRLTRPGERHLPHKILIFPCPERIGFKPPQHLAEHRGRIAGRRAPSPADIGRGRGPHDSAKRGAEAACRSSAARSCRCRMMVGSSSGFVRSRALTRHASALSFRPLFRPDPRRGTRPSPAAAVAQ